LLEPLYKPAELVDYIEACKEEINRGHQASFIVIAEDTNQLQKEDVIEKTGHTDHTPANSW